MAMSKSIRRAYGRVMEYFTNWTDEPGVRNRTLGKRLLNEIKNSPEDRFAECMTARDVFRELGVEDCFYPDTEDFLELSNKKAYDLVVEYFCSWPDNPGVTSKNRRSLANEIKNSPEGRFAECRTACDVFRELGVEDWFYSTISDFLEP